MSIWENNFSTSKINMQQFNYGQYSSPQNTVGRVSAPIIQGKQPVIGDTLELSLPKSETKTASKTPANPKTTTSTPSAKTKPMMFMGKMTNMTETIVKNDDGTMMKIYNDGENGTMAIEYDKDGKPTSISQELINGDKYKKVTTAYNNDGTMQNEMILKNLSTNASSEYVSHTDKNGRILSDSIIEIENGVETKKQNLYDENGDEIKVTETRTDDKTSTSTTTEYNSETQNQTVTESIYDIATGTEEKTEQTFDKNKNLLYDSISQTIDGETQQEYVRYDREGNLTAESATFFGKDGSVQSERIEYDPKTGIGIEVKESFNPDGIGSKTLITSDKNGNVVSESTYERDNDGFAVQTYKEYNEQQQIVTESNSTTGNGIIFTEKSSLNEEGKLQSDTLMMVNGKKYDNQADFEKALEYQYATN